MVARLLASVGIAIVLASPAFAADNPTKPNGPERQSTATPPTQNLPAQIRAKLEQDGFTNVSIVPGAFFVSAKGPGHDGDRSQLNDDADPGPRFEQFDNGQWFYVWNVVER